MKYHWCPNFTHKLRHKLINICDTEKKEKEGKKKKGLGRMEEGRKEEKEIERELALILLKEMRNYIVS